MMSREKDYRKNKKIYLDHIAFKAINIFSALYLFCMVMMVIIFLIRPVHFSVYLACLLSFVLFTLSWIWVYRTLYIPYKKMERQLQSYNLGYDSNVPNELNIYYTQEMEKTLIKIFNLFDNMNAIKLTNTNAEYRALQNQINPHFLYNTLEAIRSDAICEGADHIANITEALATFFRYTISNVNSMVTLEAELNNTENYFAIQKFRFGDKINLEINTEDEEGMFNAYQVPKLTLQPIIENAILHGLERKVGHGTIEIDFVTTGERLIIKVTDDGVGMEESVLNRINERLNKISSEGLIQDEKQKGGIALINVNNRIKLQFGEKYGLRLFSIKKFGTSVEVTLPLTKNQKVST